MKSKLLLLIAIFFSTYCFSESINIATGEWAPITSKEMEGNGFVSEIVKAAFAEEGISINLKFLPWKRCESELTEGKVDAIFPYIFTEERAVNHIFSDPIFESQTRFFFIKGKQFTYNDLIDLKEYKVGGTTGYYYEKTFKEAGLNVAYVPQDSQNLQKLISGRIDLYPGDIISTWPLIQREFPNDADKFDTLAKPLDSSPLKLMFSKENSKATQLIEKFNSGLGKIKANGIYSKILESHQLKI